MEEETYEETEAKEEEDEAEVQVDAPLLSDPPYIPGLAP